MMTLTLISNAGVLLKMPDFRVLVDGIQCEGEFPFSKTPPELLEEMLSESANGICNNLDYLIFSHTHPDHFTPALAARYLSCNRILRILFPEVRDDRTECLFRVISRTGTPYWCFKWNRGALRTYYLRKTFSVTTLCTRHMPQLFAEDLCNAVMMTVEGINILFLTDCSCGEIELLNCFSKVKIHTVFVNPYFYHDESGRKFLNEKIHPVNTVVYHIPFAEDDRLGIRSLVRLDAKKYGNKGLILFEEPFQALVIH